MKRIILLTSLVLLGCAGPKLPTAYVEYTSDWRYTKCSRERDCVITYSNSSNVDKVIQRESLGKGCYACGAGSCACCSHCDEHCGRSHFRDSTEQCACYE